MDAYAAASQNYRCPHVYHMIEKNNVTWSEADDLCGVISGRRAVIGSEDELECAHNAINDYHMQLWTAGVQLNDSWTWVTGSRYQGFSLGSLRHEQCFSSLSTTGVYEAWPSNHTLAWYLCRLPPAACSERVTSPSCHKVYSTAWLCVLRCVGESSLTWFAARNKCLQMAGDLLSLEDKTLANSVTASIERDIGSTKEIMWIGLARRPWVWNATEGLHIITYSYWEAGEPKLNGKTSTCLTVQTGGERPTWLALDCNTPLQGTLCQVSCEGSIINRTSCVTGHADDIRTKSWIKKDLSIIFLSVAGTVIFILLSVIISLLLCLRNARHLNVLLGSKPKTYFDYFDLGFRRKLPAMAAPPDLNRTVILTNNMLTSSDCHGNQYGGRAEDESFG